RVMMRDAVGGDLAVPEWLAAVSPEVSALDSTESVDATHPEDRGPLVDAFLRALASPDEEVVVQIRALHEGEWRHSLVRWINLLDHPEVGGIFCAVEDVDGPPIDPPDLNEGGVHQAANWMILTLGSIGDVLEVRGSLGPILGYSLDEVKGRVATDFVHTDSMTAAIDNWIALRSDPGQTRTSRQLWVRADGEPVWMEISFLVHDTEHIELVCLDITERMENEAALARSQAEVAALAEDFRLVADEVPMPVFRCDADGRIVFRNAQ